VKNLAIDKRIGVLNQTFHFLSFSLAQADALANLLIEKGLITEAEFMQKLSNLRLRTPGVSPGVKASEGWEGFVGLCC